MTPRHRQGQQMLVRPAALCSRHALRTTLWVMLLAMACLPHWACETQEARALKARNIAVDKLLDERNRLGAYCITKQRLLDRMALVACADSSLQCTLEENMARQLAAVQALHLAYDSAIACSQEAQVSVQALEGMCADRGVRFRRLCQAELSLKFDLEHAPAMQEALARNPNIRPLLDSLRTFVPDSRLHVSLPAIR